MKIVKNNDEQLVLKDSNYLFYIGGLGFIITGFHFLYSRTEWWVGFGAIMVGLFVIIMLKNTIVSLTKSSREISIRSRSLLKKEENKLSFDQIKFVELQEKNLSSSEGKGTSKILYFVLHDGKRVSLSLSSSSITFLGKQFSREYDIGKKVSTFLGVPFEEQRPLAVGEILSTIKSAIQEAEKDID